MSANDKIREERRPKPVKIVPVVLDETVGKRLAELVGDRKVLSMEKLFASKKAVADLKAAKAAALLAALVAVVEEVKEEEKVEPVVEEVKVEPVADEVKVEPVADEVKVEPVAEEKPVVLKAVRKPRAKRNIIVDPHAV
jgi:hypothetical protein